MESKAVSEMLEDLTKLVFLSSKAEQSIENIVAALQQDKVALLSNVTQQDADNILHLVAKKFDLEGKLEAESAFASVRGHRENVGKYFMTVNKRTDYQYVPSHSEGGHRINMQLAAFYGVENTTDGGETILLNTDQSSPEWSALREVIYKCDLGGKTLSPQQIAQAKYLFKLQIPEDILTSEDTIISEYMSPAPGIKIFNVSGALKKTYSKILKQELYVYWDSVASHDFDSGKGYFNLLKACGLVKEPAGGLDFARGDIAYPRRMLHSGIDFNSLFKAKITRKLNSGELIIMNNLTWTHSTNNWTPGSGHRKIIAAFA